MTVAVPQPSSAEQPRRFPGIVLDGMLFTLVEPDRKLAVEYNRWYEGDHFYATVVGPGVLSGRRFVCTRSLKELRIIGKESIVPGPDIGSFLALYLLVDLDAFSSWGAVNTGRLHDAGRIFTAREHIHTLLYVHRWSWSRDRGGVSPELSLDHLFGLVVTEFWQLGADEDSEEWFDRTYLPMVEKHNAPDLVLALTPQALLDGAPGDVPRAGGMTGTLLVLRFYQDAVVDQVMEEIGAASAAIEGSDGGTLRFASPFIPTVPGTDCYTDELW